VPEVPSRAEVVGWDAGDPLAAVRERYLIPDPELIYLDGNSLGRPALAAIEALRHAAEVEWGAGLIRSWDDWARLPAQVGDLLAREFLGAHPGEVVVADSTSVNLYRLLVAALDHRAGRDCVVTESGNFPTDLYVVDGVAARRGLRVRRIAADLDEGFEPGAVAECLDDSVAVVTLSHVSYRSGALADMERITALAHEAGALVLWDLSHSVGSVPIRLADTGADLAVGCGYKYLGGGPGAPAFLYVRRELQERIVQPVWGWFGQSEQFRMSDRYEPRAGIGRFLVGTPPVLALRALEAGATQLAAAGTARLWAKSARLTGLAVDLTDGWLTDHGARLASPRDPARRGSHVCVAHPRAEELTARLIEGGVVPDYRGPERLRFGMAPATTRFVDVWDAWDRLRGLLAGG